MSSMSPNEFNKWLQTVGNQFQSLSDEQRNQTLDHVIGLSGPKQLHYLSENLNALLKIDFLKQLPTEMSFYLLEFLDAQSLIQSTLVSKSWNKTINNCIDVWKRMCRNIGAKTPHEMKHAGSYKDLFLSVSSQYRRLKSGAALQDLYLRGHTDRVMAVYYRDGILATGSDDRTVRLWSCEDGRCLRIIQAHTVADVKFDDERIVTASFDNTAACWNIETGQRTTHYRGHIGAVFAVDYDVGMDILVTGSVDYSIKIWLFSEAVLLQSFSTYNAGWVTKVLLTRRVPNCSDYAIVCTDHSFLYVWRISSKQQVQEFTCWPAAKTSFIPCLQFRDSEICSCTFDENRGRYYLQKRTLNIPSKFTCTPVNYNIQMSSNIQMLLGVGERLGVFMSDSNGYYLDIIDFEKNQCIASIPLPDCRPTKRGSTFTLGDRDWLDGLDGNNDQGVVFAASLRDHSIYVLKWKQQSPFFNRFNECPVLV